MQRLKSDEFARIKGDLKVSDRVSQYAKRVLVDGESAAKVGRDFGVSRQAVNNQVRRFYAHWEQSAGVPSNWQFVAVRLPKDVAEFVKRLEQQQREKLQRS